ncbi:arsenate reductase [Parvibaculum indicum]|uniref:arsenate reductase n=1 Tax=Parvibaculum indicum TaxID=562969 RepID=UPI0014215FDA|nr:arsenate reductase [Parvibaculum indicum]NIJ42400.1 arsenate reductase [Parvibaculum indicum]
MIKVYGLKNCDTCRKALKWLEMRGTAHSFHDLRADGIARADIEKFAAAVGWEKLLNKASTTWRALDDAEKDGVNEKKAIALMAAHPALIKRPVFVSGKTIIVGFRDEQKAALEKAAK